MFLEYYGLMEQPFGVTPDPRFLYMGPAQQEAFSSLLYGIEMGRGFMALIAAPGLGKTTLLLRLMEQLQGSARSAFLFHTHANSHEFLRSLLADLDVVPVESDLGDLQRQLGDVLFQEAQAGRQLVIAIDEAQNLDDKILEMIRMLSNFETPQAKLLQVILVGQPELAHKLAAPHLEQLRQRVSIITHFPPLDDRDVHAYIDHRLRIAGYNGPPLFTPSALDLITRHGKGIPRNINNLCFHALSVGEVKEQRQIDDATVREVITDLSLEHLMVAPEGDGARPEKIAGAAPARGQTSSPIPVPVPPTTDPARIGTGSVHPPVNGPWSAPPREPIIAAPAAVGAAVFSGPAPLDAPAVELKSVPKIGSKSFLDDVNFSPRTVPLQTPRKVEPIFRKPAAPPVPLSRARRPNRGLYLVFALGVLIGGLWVGLWKESGLRSHWGAHANTAVIPVPSTTPATQDSVGLNQSATPPSRAEAPSDEAPSDVDTNTPEAPESDTKTPETPEPVEASPQPAGVSQTPVLPVRPDLNHSDAPLMGRLVVESSSSGARIFIDGRSHQGWITPRIFSIPSGTHFVTVTKWGYAAWSKRVRVGEGADNFVVARMVAISTHNGEDRGVFTVDTVPPGMQVFIDGRSYGRSRVETILPVGWHTCEVIPLPGMQPLTSRFELKSGEAVTRRIRLAGFGNVRSDGRRAGGSAESLPPGGQTP